MALGVCLGIIMFGDFVFSRASGLIRFGFGVLVWLLWQEPLGLCCLCWVFAIVLGCVGC